MTDARHRALLVLLHGERTDRPVYESNRTTDPGRVDSDRLTVYWQTRAWLERQQYVTQRFTPQGHQLSLTPEGYRVALERAA